MHSNEINRNCILITLIANYYWSIEIEKKLFVLDSLIQQKKKKLTVRIQVKTKETVVESIKQRSK